MTEKKEWKEMKVQTLQISGDRAFCAEARASAKREQLPGVCEEQVRILA